MNLKKPENLIFPAMWQRLSFTAKLLPVSAAALGSVAVSSCLLDSTAFVACDETHTPLRRHESRLVPRRLSRLVNEFDGRSFVSRAGTVDPWGVPNEANEESEQYYVDPDKQANTMILAPPHNSELVAEVCANLGVSLSRSFWGKFADGECRLKVLDEVRGADCFIILPVERDSSHASSAGALLINDSIMEMILMIGALRRSSARTITVVLPYVPYARHMETLPDGIDLQATPPAGSDVAQMIESIGADRVICVDVHSGAWEGCFSPNVGVSNIDPQGLAVKYFESKRLVSPVIVSPDVVASDRAKSFWKRMRLHGFHCSLATMVNNRKYHEQVTRLYDAALPFDSVSKIRLLDDGQLVLPSGKIVSLGTLRTREWLVGDVAGRDCIIVDDMIDSGKRLMKTSETLRKSGARKIYMYATHGVMSASAMRRIDESPVTEVLVTNTICPRRDMACEKLRVLSVAGLISETIRRVQMGESVSSLYDKSVVDREEDDSRHYQ